MKLTYLFLFITCICFAQEKDILLIGNYDPICIEGENIQRVEVLPDDLNNYQIIMHFVKTNLKLFLRLVSTDIHNDEVSLTANEFNSLRVLFKVKN